MNKRSIFTIAAVLVLVAGVSVAQYAPGSNYDEPGGLRSVIQGSLDVVSGGDLDIESGAALKLAGTTVTATAAELNAIDGVGGAGGLTLANGESLNTNTDDVFDFTRDDAGIVTLTCSDDNAVAACTYDAGGAAPIVVGSADVTIVTITTDDTGDGTDLVLPAQGVNGSEILNNTVTAVQTSDTLCLQVVAVEVNPTEAGATNDFINLVDNSFSTTEADEDSFRVPVAAIAHNLAVEVDVAPGVGNDDWKITLQDDTSATALTCNIDEAATTCADSANSPTVAALSNIDILVDSSGGGADPDAAALITVSFCLGQ